MLPNRHTTGNSRVHPADNVTWIVAYVASLNTAPYLGSKLVLIGKGHYLATSMIWCASLAVGLLAGTLSWQR